MLSSLSSFGRLGFESDTCDKRRRAHAISPPTISIMRFIRRIVSKNNRRFQADGFDLDLAYVTSGIIAMGYPSEGGEGLYRNPMGETVEFLNRYHRDRFRVYNLCSEKSYDKSRFGANVVRYPCRDLQAPSLYVIKLFCEDVSKWLDEDAENVAAVHCKAGRGRTGVLISCLLLWKRVCWKPEEAIRFYGDARTVNGKAVTIPSQIRYVHHFHDMFLKAHPNGEIPPRVPRRVRIHSVSLNGLPRHLINGATVRLSARGKQEASADKVVFSLRTYTKDKWRCFGPASGRQSEDIQLYVQGNKIHINRAAFKHSDKNICCTGGPGRWWAGGSVPALLPACSESSTDLGDCVQANWGVLRGVEDRNQQIRHSQRTRTMGMEVSQKDPCQARKNGIGRLQREDKVTARANRNNPMDFIFDWDINLEVFSSASRGKLPLFHAWENTIYLPESGVLTLKRDQLDRVKKSVQAVVVEMRFRDVDMSREGPNGSANAEENQSEEDSIHAPTDWSCMASDISQHNHSEIALSEMGSESQASTNSQSSRRFPRSFPSLSSGQLAWSPWSLFGADPESDALVSSISQSTCSAWQSFDAAWSLGWSGVPTSHSMCLPKL